MELWLEMVMILLGEADSQEEEDGEDWDTLPIMPLLLFIAV